MTVHEAAAPPDPRHAWFIRGTVLLAVATMGVYLLPLSADSLGILKELLLVVAFALPLWPLSQARAVTEGEHSLSWLLLLAGSAAGLAGQVVWIVFRLTVGSGASFLPAEVNKADHCFVPFCSLTHILAA